MDELILKYGCNPHQKPARIFCSGGLPIKVLGGAPGYINLLDALNGWQLVRELKAATGLSAAASFKHVSPAGAAVAVPLTEALRRAYFVEEIELSPLACAYARARGADRVSSFGDWIALSDVCDLSTADLIRREVSDGVIAPGYDPGALEILKRKKGGAYNVVEIAPDYDPPGSERREVFGVTFEQRRNDVPITESLLDNVVTKQTRLTETAKRDLLVAMITLKYTQSNSVCLALDGQVIGVGAGQQSRIHCTRLAADKANLWYLRQHPLVLDLPFRDGLKRPERDNGIDQFLRTDLTGAEAARFEELFSSPPPPLKEQDRQAWIARFQETALASDAFFPFRDSIDRAACSGVKYVAQPGGSLRDKEVVEACDEYGMTMIFTGLRLFHH